MKRLLFVLATLSLIFTLSAKVITGVVLSSETEQPVADATVMAVVNDSIRGMDVTDASGRFSLRLEETDEGSSLALDVQAIGYDENYTEVNPEEPAITVRLARSENVTQLDEVVVEGDRSMTVQRLPNGQRFFLSDKAKAMTNPFMALQEIPALISDPANSTVSTIDGNAPKVLIDGKELNSGIAPILPEDIESVEVINVVSARYLATGTTSVLNINLRKNRPPYIWTELATRHEVPFRKGFGVWYFEVGNEKVSLYGRTSYNYTYHSDMDGDVEQRTASYNQNYDWHNRRNADEGLGELLLKYVPDSRNYFALEGYATGVLSHSRSDSRGYFTTAEEMDYSSYSKTNDRSVIATASAYYKHEFNDISSLQVKADYNYNLNRLHTFGSDEYGSDTVDTDYLFNSTRHSGSANVTYSATLAGNYGFEAGSRTTLVNDRIVMNSHPRFRHHNYKEYLYASFSGEASKWYYYASAGAMLTWLRAGETANRYVRPYISGSLTCLFNPSNSMMLQYRCTNSDPNVQMLNPYDTSTDPLVATVGNPYLKPAVTHSLTLQYTVNTQKGFYGSFDCGPGLRLKGIMADGYLDTDGVFVNTYANKGRMGSFYTQFHLSQYINSRKLYGRVYGGGYWMRKFYQGQSPKDEFSMNVGGQVYFGKFLVAMSASYMPRSYGLITMTKYLNLTDAQVQVNYFISPNLYVALAVQGFTGYPNSRTYTDSGDFHSVQYSRQPELGFHPWILIRWNMRRHVHRKINLDNVLNSTETGIRLK